MRPTPSVASSDPAPSPAVEPENPPRKPVSARKRAANRANAARSTGPRTEAGKAASKFNAVAHGLASYAPILPGEDPEELELLYRSVEASLRPRGGLEEALVDRAVTLLWRLRRLVPAEQALFDEEQEDRLRSNMHRQIIPLPAAIVGEPPPDELSSGSFLAEQFQLRGTSPLERLGVYEQRLDRGLHATLRQLHQLQKLRRELEDAGDHDDRPAEPADPPAPAPTEQAATNPAAEPAEPADSSAAAEGAPPEGSACPPPASECAIVQNEATAGAATPVPDLPATPPEAPAGTSPATPGG